MTLFGKAADGRGSFREHFPPGELRARAAIDERWTDEDRERVRARYLARWSKYAAALPEHDPARVAGVGRGLLLTLGRPPTVDEISAKLGPGSRSRQAAEALTSLETDPEGESAR